MEDGNEGGRVRYVEMGEGGGHVGAGMEVKMREKWEDRKERRTRGRVR